MNVLKNYSTIFQPLLNKYPKLNNILLKFSYIKIQVNLTQMNLNNEMRLKEEFTLILYLHPDKNSSEF